MPITAKRVRSVLIKLLASAGILLLLFFLLNQLFPVPDKVDYSVIVTDSKGEVIHGFLTPDQQWRMKTELKDISPLLKKTIVEKEDRYFYYHPGINGISIIRALCFNIFRGKRTSGASTITMQVARALEPKKRTYFHKLQEMFRAVQLEWKYSKEEILQLYLNLVPYGGNIEGVKSASILYFNKNPDHLSLAEITALSIIPNRPSSLVIGKNNSEIVRERNRWLNTFREQGIFTEKEISDALQEPLTAKRRTVPFEIPHLANKLKSPGTTAIHTYINMHTQKAVEKIVSDYAHSMQMLNIRNAAVIVLDNATHHVISYTGSANFNDTTDHGQVNGATAIREPGSTLKPLLYGMCIDEGLLTPKMAISDVAVNYDGYAPENYDKKFNGPVSMEYALEHSLNIPAVTSLRMLGKDKFIRKLSDCQFKSIRKDQRKLGLSVILGGCGATLEELTGLYSSFACEGLYTKPSFQQGEASIKPVRVLTPQATFLINETLTKINRPDFPLNWQSTEHMPKIAWKTGTSYGKKDAWSIGYNRHFTIGIWVGNFSAQGIPELSGANIATPLLFKIFNTIDYDSDEQWFSAPAGMESRQVCSETGLTPSEFCTNLVTDYYIPQVSPNLSCDNRKEVMVNPSETISYCMDCVAKNGFKKKWYPVIAPELQAWMQDNHMAFTKMPPHNPACEKIFREGAPLIKSPVNGVEYIISKKHPEPIQLSGQATNEVSRLYWYINNKFLVAADPHTKKFFVPEEGPVKISCTDDKGRNRDIWIRVRRVDL